MYALFIKDRRISKWYPHKLQAIIHAYEKGFVVCGRGKKWLTAKIKEDK